MKIHVATSQKLAGEHYGEVCVRASKEDTAENRELLNMSGIIPEASNCKLYYDKTIEGRYIEVEDVQNLQQLMVSENLTFTQDNILINAGPPPLKY